MKKLLLLSTFTLALFLSGCINYEQIATVKSNGSGKMYIHYWSGFLSEQDSALFSRFSLFNEDTLQNRFSSAYTNLDNIEVYKNYSDSTVHAKVEFDFTHIDSLNNMTAFRGSEFSFKEGPDDTRLFSQTVILPTVGLGINPAAVYEFSYTYYFTGNVLSHNGNLEQSNKVVWEYSSDSIPQERNITVSFRPYKLDATPIWIYILALVVIVVVIGYVFSQKKR